MTVRMTRVCLCTELRGAVNGPCLPASRCTDVDAVCDSTNICQCRHTHFLRNDVCGLCFYPLLAVVLLDTVSAEAGSKAESQMDSQLMLLLQN